MAIGTTPKFADFLWCNSGPAGHACHLYQGDAELIDTLTGYVGGALWKGDAVVVIATRNHGDALEHRLRESGLDLGFLRTEDRFISAPAEGTLAQVSVEGRPDAARFRNVIDPLVARAAADGRRVRLFGEMVGLLWAQGRYADAVHLEQLWNRYLEGRALPLLCAYPRERFRAAGPRPMAAVREAHSVFLG